MYESGYRSLVKYSIFLLLIPLGCYLIHCAVGYVTGSTLYEGDQLELRKCRVCSAPPEQSPSEEPDDFPVPPRPNPEDCPVCARKGEVEVVIPGPLRPTRFWGVVVDRAKVPEGDEETWCPRTIGFLTVQAAFLPAEEREISGGVARATVLFLTESGDVVEARTDAQGRFTTRLAPGNYKVKVAAGAFATLEASLSVAPLTAPIWNEKVDTFSSVEGSDDEGRSNRGLAVVIALVRPEEGDGYLRQFPVPR